jgi:hypothetical protein
MAKRVSYTYDKSSVLTQVLIIWPQNRAEYFVYCPPIGAENPWVEEFADYDDAVAAASHLIARTGQRHVQLTRDTTPWWLTGLEPA